MTAVPAILRAPRTTGFLARSTVSAAAPSASPGA